MFLLCILAHLCFIEDHNLEAPPPNVRRFAEELIDNTKIGFFHHVESISTDAVTLSDGSLWKIGSSYRSVLTGWKRGDRLKITYTSSYFNHIVFENCDKNTTARGVLSTKPSTPTTLVRITASPFATAEMPTLTLSNGLVFKGNPTKWRAKDEIFVFHDQEQFKLHNMTLNQILPMKCVGDEKQGTGGGVLNLERSLNKHILGQKQASHIIASQLINCFAGLSDPESPYAVFLFLGPTGVGKTEMVKAITHQLFKNLNHLIRFDMSHFSERYTITRLVGSPPGYLNNEEGGQLTNALREKPEAIILLDEIEKAHPVVRKAFLPVFDEGFITDAHNQRYSCTHHIFVMTSNIAALEIADLFHQGCSASEVLETIEPIVMEALSPELYNRVVPIVFEPLSPDVMHDLVDQMLEGVVENLMRKKKMTLTLDESAHKYLEIHGYHPSLGARPLWRLIQKKVVGNLSYAIIAQGIPDGTHLTLSYRDKMWCVDW